MKELNEIEDHKIVVKGKNIDEFEDGEKICFGIIAEVAGKKMQKDFESVFERKFHAYINCAEGIMHTGQLDMIRIRVSHEATNKGFKFEHFGEIIYAKLMSEYDKVIDKCQVTIYTDPEEVGKLRHELVIPTFNERNARTASMTDESVDVFYTCILCQAFSPSHVCIVTPERLGLCGAVSWLDAKATHQLEPDGPSQIVTKEKCQDERLGRYDDVDEAVKKFSRGALERVTLYSIMEDPMTSCGCFECICGIEPMSNGVVIVNREHTGVSPIGMTFSDLASMTGGGVQTPGFMGHGKHFIASKKFLAAEGGLERLVWLPKKLKEEVGEAINKTAKELYDIDNFTDMIADETIAEDGDALMAFLTEKNHPALGLEPMM
jgi:acetyl-CoA synthase